MFRVTGLRVCVTCPYLVFTLDAYERWKNVLSPQMLARIDKLAREGQPKGWT